jgi:hypothetical protein
MTSFILIKITTLLSLIYTSMSILNCSVANTTNTSLCTTCATGYRLTYTKTICGNDSIVNCLYLNDISVSNGYTQNNAAYSY